MADKIVAIFAEGATEIEFYKAVVMKAREKIGTHYACKVEYIDMKGIGNYKKDALRKFNKIKEHYPEKDIFAFFCIDNDVFEFSKKPPFNKKDIQIALQNAGAKKVVYIIANKSIEDWFLCDFEGVLNYLHLPRSTKKPKGNGQKALKDLFKMAHKLYVKGSKTEGFIEKLDVLKIMRICCAGVRPLCKCLGLDCKKLCNK